MLAKLVWVTLKNEFGLSVLRDRWRRREKIWEPIVIVLSMLLGFSTFAGILYFLFKGVAEFGAALGQPELVFTVAIIGSQFLALLMGTLMVISSFYFSKDLSILVPLPLRGSQIVVAKLMHVMATEYLLGAVLYVPACVAFAQVATLTGWRMLLILVNFLLMPVIPLVVAAIASLLLMKVINRRHRDLLMVIFSVVFMLIALSFSMAPTALGENDPQAMLLKILTEHGALLQVVGRRFPPALWGSRSIGMAGSLAGLLNLGLVLAVAAVGLAVLWVLAERLFHAGLVGGEEVAGRRKALSRTELAKRTEEQGVFAALFWREWKLFMRTPLFVMNGLAGAVVMPLVMVVSLLMQSSEIGEMLTQVQTPTGRMIAALIIAAIIGFLGSVNAISSTSISREGRLFYISKVIPVPAQLQARAKIMHAASLAVLSALPMLIAYVLLLKPGVVEVAFSLAIGLAASLLGIVLGLYVDMRRPRLDWTNPQRAMKENYNVLIPMFLNMLSAGLGALLTWWLYSAHIAPPLIYLALFALFGASSWLSYRLVIRQAKVLYLRLEV